MAGAAPQSVARGAFTGAGGEPLDVAGDLEVLMRGVPGEVRGVAGDPLSGAEVGEAAAGALDATDAGEMALGTDGVAAFGIELCGVDHGDGGGVLNMLAAGAVAAFAADTVIRERRVGVAILRAADKAHLAGMAEEATALDGAVETDFGIFLVARRGVPGNGVDVVRHGQFEEEALAFGSDKCAPGLGADEVLHGRTALVEDQAIAGDAVALSGSGEFCRRHLRDGAAGLRHGGPRIGVRDGGVTGAALLAANKDGRSEEQHLPLVSREIRGHAGYWKRNESSIFCWVSWNSDSPFRGQ